MLQASLDHLEAGYDYKDIAILTRTNAQLQNFEASLYRHGIPYSIVDGLSFVQAYSNFLHDYHHSHTNLLKRKNRDLDSHANFL